MVGWDMDCPRHSLLFDWINAGEVDSRKTQYRYECGHNVSTVEMLALVQR